jgi:hypothetical protein
VIPVPSFGGDAEENMLATGVSPGSGDYVGAGVIREAADHDGVPTLGTLMRYQKYQDKNGIFDTICGVVKNAASAILPLAAGVAKAAFGGRGDVAIPLTISAVRPQGSLGTRVIGVDGGLPQGYYKPHWPKYAAGNRAYFGTIYGPDSSCARDTATVVGHYKGTVHFNGSAFERNRYFYPAEKEAAARRAGKSSMTVAMMGSRLSVRLRCAINWVHGTPDDVKTLPPELLTPWDTAGVVCPEVGQNLPIIQNVDTPMTFQGARVGAFCPISLELPVESTIAAPYPKRRCVNGTWVDYKPDDLVAFLVNIVPELICEPQYPFTGVVGDGATQATWHPEDFGIAANYPGAVEVTGTPDTMRLGDYGHRTGMETFGYRVKCQNSRQDGYRSSEKVVIHHNQAVSHAQCYPLIVGRTIDF